MYELSTLVNRHIKNFLRDKMSVFFSFLSIIILLGIYLLFLGSFYSELSILTGVENTIFILGYIMGGVIVIGTITLSLGVIGSYVSDLESKRINGFLVSPIKRSTLTLSYYLSTVILTLFLTLIMFFLMFFYLGISLGYWYPPMLVLSAILTITVYVFISTSLVVFLATLIKSNNAFGGISAIIGTVIGFVGGIYIPISMLSSFMVSFAGLLPFSYMTIFLRKMLIGNELLLKVPNEALVGMGLIDLNPFNLNLSMYWILGIFIALSFALLMLTYFRVNKKTK
ncbi:MAG: ABC transporter permease [Clostridia bacterium]|nr:ABC transporter permease [Clostridia bacterium]MDD4686205.1 ABC transporter permease [Clostridia bacterium]